MEDEVISFLKEKEDVPTLTISKHIYGEKGTKKMINPLLYKLQKDGKIIKSCQENGGNPQWNLCLTE